MSSRVKSRIVQCTKSGEGDLEKIADKGRENWALS